MGLSLLASAAFDLLMATLLILASRYAPAATGTFLPDQLNNNIVFLAEPGPGGGGFVKRAQLQCLDQQLDRGQWGPQLVRDVGHEVAAHPFQTRRRGLYMVQGGTELLGTCSLDTETVVQAPYGRRQRGAGGGEHDADDQQHRGHVLGTVCRQPAHILVSSSKR